MTPKLKAEEVFNKYFSELRLPSDCEGCMQCVDRCGNMVAVAKKYALIAVAFAKENPLNTDGYNKYLEEVKQEIEKL